jgi:Phage tail tube protein
MTSFFPSDLLAASIGKEAVFGTGVAPALSIPVTDCGPADAHAPIADAAWRGAPVTSYGHAPGPLASVVQLAGPVYADAIGFPLAGVLGDLVTTVGAPNTHAIALQCAGRQQTPSYTINTADGLHCLQWAGCKFANVQLAAAGDGLLTWQATVTGLSAVEIAAPARNYSNLAPLAGWRGAVQLGGATEAMVLAMSVTLDRNIVAQRNTDGARAPYGQRPEELTASGTLALAMRADTYRQQYVNGTTTSVDLNFTQGAGGALQQVKLHASLVTLTDVHPTYGGDWVELDMAWVADANTTDIGASGGYSPIKATLKNTIGAGIYA